MLSQILNFWESNKNFIAVFSFAFLTPIFLKKVVYHNEISFNDSLQNEKLFSDNLKERLNKKVFKHTLNDDFNWDEYFVNLSYLIKSMSNLENLEVDSTKAIGFFSQFNVNAMQTLFSRYGVLNLEYSDLVSRGLIIDNCSLNVQTFLNSLKKFNDPVKHSLIFFSPKELTELFTYFENLKNFSKI